MAVNCTQHHIQRWIWSVLIGMQPIFIMLCVQRWSIWCWGARPRRPNRSAQGENPEQIPRIQSKLDAIVHPIAQQIITDINNRKCIKEIGLWCVWMKALFLASTVSAMHRNAFISNASHPLVVTYYCWVTVYSPSMKAKKNYPTNTRNRTMNTRERKHASAHFAKYEFETQWEFVTSFSEVKCRDFKLQITTCAMWKNSVNAKNNESCIYILFKLYMQV